MKKAWAMVAKFRLGAGEVAAIGLVLAVTGCIGQLPNLGGAHPSIRTPTSGEIADCRHIRNLHDLFSISSAGLAVASGASGVSTIAVDSSRGKNTWKTIHHKVDALRSSVR